MRRFVSGSLLAAVVAVSAATSAGAQAPAVTVETFPIAVAEASAAAPVFVNFYAPWCGPCQTFFDVLDKVAADYEGRATFLSMNVDDSEVFAGQFGISQIPAVVAFRNGEPDETLVGVQSEAKVREFFDRQVAAGSGNRRQMPEFTRDITSASLPCNGDACEALVTEFRLVLECMVRNVGGRAITVRAYAKSGNVLTIPEIAPGADARLGTPTGCLEAGAIAGFEASYLN
jgi:thioredoxin